MPPFFEVKPLCSEGNLLFCWLLGSRVLARGVNAFQQLCGRVVFQELFLEVGLDGKEVVNLWSIFEDWGSRLLEIAITKFTSQLSQLLFDLLFMCILKDALLLVTFHLYYLIFIIFWKLFNSVLFIAYLRGQVYTHTFKKSWVGLIFNRGWKIF